MGEVAAPEPITASHHTESFACSIPVLDEWLRRRALKNEVSGASRTFVICQDRQVVGYYSLATGSVEHRDAPGKIHRNMPNPIPVMVLGRLAVDQQWQQTGLGRGLLKDALLRSLSVSKHAGVRALLVHALSEDAKKFYAHSGFLESPLDPMTLMIALQHAAHCL
ncbi:MAG: GNAT family N-acetyltransferase [Gammaproteobacteria bacterium]